MPPGGLLVEDALEERLERGSLSLGEVAFKVAHEVHVASLPGGTEEDLGDGFAEAFVGVADDELDAVEAAPDQRAQELLPGGFALAGEDVGADDLAVAIVADGVGDDERTADDAAAVADVDVLGIEPDVGAGPLEGALAPRFDLVGERFAGAGDAALVIVLEAHGLYEMVDLPGADPVDVCLLDDTDERLFAASTRFEERWLVPGVAQLGDAQLDGADARLPGALAVPLR